MTKNTDVEAFYDNFVTKQKKRGVSIRHRIIHSNLKKIGLQRNSNVLEIGCGIGTVSKLIISSIPDGHFVGCDISPKSIADARAFNPQKNAEFIVTDMADFSHPVKFDFIIFPDVLEHIPVEQHANIFEKVSKISSPTAKILINIPEPNCLNYYRKHHPENLQIIDQSLSMQDLMNNIYPYGFQVQSITPYEIHSDVDNYLSIVFIRDTEIKKVVVKNKVSQNLQNIFVYLKG